MSRHLVGQMCSLVDGAGLSRDSIHFELTESALASNADFAKQQLEALAAAGFHLHLDDFGTGYSSLHRLQSLQELGCHLIQGYLHARPMPLEALLAWLAQRQVA